MLSSFFYLYWRLMIIYKGFKGKNVRKIQVQLSFYGYYKGALDSVFGTKTEKAVIVFQKNEDIFADGVVGIQTWKAMFKGQKHLEELIYPPDDREELGKMFADPLIPDYWTSYGDFIRTPSELDHCFKSQFDGHHGFWCNKLIIPYLLNVYRRIAECGASKELITFDGCYNLRYTRGSKKLSMHSWGIAIDHNAATNALGSEGDMHEKIVAAFEIEGFTWGGNFRRKDPMHFEYTQDGL